MKTHALTNTSTQGFTLMEIMMAMLVLAITLSVFMIGQQSTWSNTGKNNRFLVACQIIEKQIEWRRMTISKNPAVNYASFKALNDTTIIDNSVKPPVTVVWTMSSTYDPNGKVITNVRKAKLTASWGSGKDDTLRVTTCIARDF